MNNMSESKQHVQLPNDMTKLNILTPQDLLVYLTLKRYMDNETKIAYPSLLTIAEDCGATINTIRKYLINLEKAGYISIKKKGRSNVYEFLKWDKFEPFSYKFLDKPDLSFNEKAYLVASQQYMFKEEGEGKISMSDKDLSNNLNISESFISKCDKSLEKKNYLQIVKAKDKLGVNIKEKFYHLNELEQAIVFKLQDHEDRITDNTSKIEKLEKALETLQRDNQLLLKELRENKKEVNQLNY